MKTLTDEELAELERVCKSWATRRAGDSFVYVAASVFGGLASLLAEVRELRTALKWERDHACETPPPGCECPGCSLCREEWEEK